MTPKEKLAAAEKTLKDLEVHRHRVEDAHVAHVKAQQDGDPAKVKAANEAHAKVVAGRAAANVDEQAIHVAAQAVLDARAEVDAVEGKK